MKEVTTDCTIKQRIILEYHERLYAIKSNKLEEMGMSLEIYNLHKLNHKNWKI